MTTSSELGVGLAPGGFRFEGDAEDDHAVEQGCEKKRGRQAIACRLRRMRTGSGDERVPALTLPETGRHG